MIASLKEHATTSTRATLDNLSQVYGITYNTSSIMFDERLLKFATPATGTYWDWMHILVASGGVLQYEANQLVRSIVQAGVGLAELDEFASKNGVTSPLGQVGKVLLPTESRRQDWGSHPLLCIGNVLGCGCAVFVHHEGAGTRKPATRTLPVL